MKERIKWTEREIGRSLYVHVFRMKHLVIVPNCCFTGAECDLLVVRNDLRLMDVEIKISRADLKADKHKDKWLKPWDFALNHWRPAPKDRERVEHPDKIWKHYYAVPSEIWTDELFAEVSPASGVLLIRSRDTYPLLTIRRQAKPNREASPISAEDMVKVARSMNARMWDAYGEMDQHRREKQHAQVAA